MKATDIEKALTDVDQKYVEEARVKRGSSIKWGWIAAAAAMLFVAVTGGIMGAKTIKNHNIGQIAYVDPTPVQTAISTEDADQTAAPSEKAAATGRTYALAAYTETPGAEDGSYYKYLNTLRQSGVMGEGSGLVEFFASSSNLFLLSKGDNTNAVCSPFSMYMALAMLAEVTEGETRAQILDALGAGSIEELRAQYAAVYEASYRNSDDIAVTMPAASLWLREDESYNADTMGRLAELYKASVFGGTMGDPEYDAMIKRWIDERTGGLLEDMSGNAAKTSPDCVMKILSTLYFKARWDNDFYGREEGVFHSRDGDVQIEYLKGAANAYVKRQGYALVCKALLDGSAMWFVLPDDGAELKDIVTEGEALSYLMSGGPSASETSSAKLLMPELDISFENSIIDMMKSLGITDCFDSAVSDFSPLTDAPGLEVGEASHGARLVADREGVVAAAFTHIDLNYGGMPNDNEPTVKLDRPFMFILMSADSTPLFIGTAYEPAN